MRWSKRRLAPLVGIIAVCAAPATAAAHLQGKEGGASSSWTAFTSSVQTLKNMQRTSSFPKAFTNSDMAFWGSRAFVGNYGGFRIFDVSKPTPVLLSDFSCLGAQNDVSVWDRDEDGEADLLIASVDRTMQGSACGMPVAAHDDRNGWEGLRLFDVSNPSVPRQIGAVYQHCGSHTHTLIPRRSEGRLLVLNSSYPLRPGPTCGPVNGPAAGRDELHGTVQVVEVPLDDPAAARTLTEIPVEYPGDPDNVYKPISEHNLNGGSNAGGALIDGMRACHDISVFTALNLVSAACGEQAQMWRLDPRTGIPDSGNPLWVYDQPNVDFWHSATFSWDGRVTNFIDESFGDGCPTTTVKTAGVGEAREYASGNMFFMNTKSGGLYSEMRIGHSNRTGPGAYCSSHLGNVVPSTDRYVMANAYYRGGSSVIDFTDPTAPREIAYGNLPTADTWSAYWWETNASKRSTMSVFSNDGVHEPATGGGFETWVANVGELKRKGLRHLNPQTQERVFRSDVVLPSTEASQRLSRKQQADRKGSRYAAGERTTRRGRYDKTVTDHLATG